MARTPTWNGGRSRSAAFSLFHDCYLYTSARRYKAMGKGVPFRLCVRNFTSELLRGEPRVPGSERQSRRVVWDVEICKTTDRHHKVTVL